MPRRSSLHLAPVLASIIAGLVISFFALFPQITFCLERGSEWHGTYTAIDWDEPFYAAYVQSLIDGKPRRNSPYTGAEDKPGAPQKESYLSIQFLSSYPTAGLATLFGLSSSSGMILILGLLAFLSGISVFYLIYILTEDAGISLVGTLIVLLGGAMAGGQGGVLSFAFPGAVHYASPLLFLRRSVPAMSFPALILFFVFVSKLVAATGKNKKLLFCFSAVGCFVFTVFGYFYHWTTAVAWLLGFLVLWSTLRPADVRSNIRYLAALGSGLILVLVPYVFLLFDRSADTDSALLLTLTHHPDLFRPPALISYATLLLFLVFGKLGWITIREPRTIILISFAILAPVVFNQQVLSGRSLQPFHYQIFSANYLSVLAISTVVLVVMKQRLQRAQFRLILACCVFAMVSIGYFEASFAAGMNRDLNIWRDDLVPVARRLKEIAGTPEFKTQNKSTVVLAFDSLDPIPITNIELPAISSLPVLWGPHQRMFPDVSAAENRERLLGYLHYQNLDERWVRNQLKGGDPVLAIGFFGGVRSDDPSINDSKPLDDREITEAMDRYREFRETFNVETARSPALTFVITRRDRNTDLSVIDRWYERDMGEAVGEYVLYRLRLRDP